MMHNLLLEEGDIVQIESVSLPVATFSKFKPQCPDFLEITNQKAVLENALRNFACLTTGDLVAIKYNSKIYELCVLETKPGNAVSIIECDMNVRATHRLFDLRSIEAFLFRDLKSILFSFRHNRLNSIRRSVIKNQNVFEKYRRLIMTMRLISKFITIHSRLLHSPVREIVSMAKRKNVINQKHLRHHV